MIVRLTSRTAADPQLLGGKASSLARLASLGARVPPAFVLTTDAYRHGLDEQLWEQTLAALEWLETVSGRRFGEDLLVSVRSGAPISMPGMMDTILNVGLGPKFDGPTDFRAACQAALQRSFETNCGMPEVPEDPYEQLRAAVEAVFLSWESERAQLYRRIRGIDDKLGTTATVQAMVFGNRGPGSGTGVLLTRDTTTGAREPLGEFCAMAQGEELVSGTTTPERLERMGELMPNALRELLQWGEQLERQSGDVQDIEFTVEEGTLYLLQARNAKRTVVAACEIAVDLAEQGVIDREEALRRTAEIDLDTVSISEVRKPAHTLAVGRGVVLKVGTGRVATSSEAAIRLDAQGERPILVTDTTSPNDLAGMRVAAGIVTRRGGLTSHAALVARELGVACVVGAGELGPLADDEQVTVDGAAGAVYLGLHEHVEYTPRAVDVLREWRTRSGAAEQVRV